MELRNPRMSTSLSYHYTTRLISQNPQNLIIKDDFLSLFYLWHCPNQQIKVSRKQTSVKVINLAFGECVFVYHQITTSFELVQA